MFGVGDGDGHDARSLDHESVGEEGRFHQLAAAGPLAVEERGADGPGDGVAGGEVRGGGGA